ncbi:lipoprotein [Mesoplasma coleopterae]|uniref:lipoprotein n=1 Tax=Mesoplasma coleopterae TaxID=324078 RepID=UPI000D039D38|nr:lipoprotein [Mesoplasma coleopterae]AVN62067.1 hypothetical protein CG001_00120 [Mesoplasma coleopterae]AVN62729.1 hypothetical protein CG000_00155 [Mesoplasma coleopterae]
MKKLLAVLGAIGLTATGASAVVSCGGNNGDKDITDPETGLVALSKVKNLVLDLGEIGTNTSANISKTFFDKNESVLKKAVGDTITSNMLYVSKITSTSATITGKNSGQELLSPSADFAVTVAFTATNDTRLDLAATTNLVKKGLEVDKSKFEGSGKYDKSNSIADALIAANKDLLKGTVAKDYYLKDIVAPTEGKPGTAKIEGSTSSLKVKSGSAVEVEFTFI